MYRGENRRGPQGIQPDKGHHPRGLPSQGRREAEAAFLPYKKQNFSAKVKVAANLSATPSL